MNSSQGDTKRKSDRDSIGAILLPPPGPFARAVFRCALFASVSVLAAFAIGIIADGQVLLQAAGPVAAVLSLPLLFLSIVFIRAEPWLALLAIFVILLFILVGFAAPTYAE